MIICEVIDREVILSADVNAEANRKVAEFVQAMSDKRQSINYYEEKRNTTAGRAHYDNLLGKKCEIFVGYYLRNCRGFPLQKVDFAIRYGGSKGWDIDLPYASLDPNFPNVHVKACSFATYDYVRDYSWTLNLANNEGTGGRDKIFDGPDEDHIALVYAPNPYCPRAVIKAILPWGVAKQCLGPPRKEELQEIKRCIDYRKIREVLNEKGSAQSVDNQEAVDRSDPVGSKSVGNTRLEYESSR